MSCVRIVHGSHFRMNIYRGMQCKFLFKFSVFPGEKIDLVNCRIPCKFAGYIGNIKTVHEQCVIFHQNEVFGISLLVAKIKF